MCNTRKKRVKEHQSKLPQSDRHPTRADERACCGIGIHSDRQGHPKEHGSGIGTGTTRAAACVYPCWVFRSDIHEIRQI